MVARLWRDACSFSCKQRDKAAGKLKPLPDCHAPACSLSGGWVFFYDWF